jgi:hypothetical protein
VTKLEIDPAAQKIIDDFDAHAKRRFAALLGRQGSPLQATAEVSFCLGYKAGVIDLGAAQREEAAADVVRMAKVVAAAKAQNWAVTASYSAPGSRPGNRRHPAPEDFGRRTVVGPAATSTVETVLDLLEVPEDVRAKIRANTVVQNFVEGMLVPDHPYPHHMVGMHYVSDAPDAQLVEWSLEFAFVTQFVEPVTGEAP